MSKDQFLWKKPSKKMEEIHMVFFKNYKNKCEFKSEMEAPPIKNKESPPFKLFKKKVINPGENLTSWF